MKSDDDALPGEERTELTEVDHELATRVAAGLTDEEIATQLEIPKHRVAEHACLQRSVLGIDWRFSCTRMTTRRYTRGSARGSRVAPKSARACTPRWIGRPVESGARGHGLLSGGRAMSQEERRSERRYPVQQPASVRFVAEGPSEVTAVAENVSTRGLLLRSESPIPLHSKVEVTVSLPEGPPLKGAGEVLRVEQPPSGGAFLVAVVCDAPLW
jgi:hypothetical protein